MQGSAGALQKEGDKVRVYLLSFFKVKGAVDLIF